VPVKELNPCVAEAVKELEISRRVVDHYRRHARDLPFRRTRDPYAIWVCEIMAQQTRLSVVIPYWERWLARFPTVAALAEAPLDDVLAHWSGLGYYARARSLHRAACVIVDQHGGRVPSDPVALGALPGIGPYTAGAIGSIAFGQRVPVVDGNVVRILARVYAIEEDPTSAAVKSRMWALAGELVPHGEASEFNQGLMDIGATVCTPRSPTCLVCPLATLCDAHATGRQESLPIARKKAATPRVDVSSAWVVDGRGRWLLFRRQPKGLFGGLWELPDADALRAAAHGAEITIDARPLAEHVHQLSHRTMRYRVFRTTVNASSGRLRLRLQAPYDASRWFSPDALATLGISSVTSALARRLSDRERDRERDLTPWPTPNKRTRSSSRASTASSRG
jgi:A/G-specific adenine glycosylase